MATMRAPIVQPAVDRQQSNTLILFGIAAAVALLHILTNNRYGFHRDELQFLSDARHMDWGFVAYPPVTAFLEHIGLSLFGTSLAGLRIFSVVAQSIAIIMAGLMARELGGAKLAQVSTALMVSFSALPMFEGTEFQYSSFDYLWWVLIAYFVIRLLKNDDPRWWLAIGATIGVGLETKYTVCFFIAGLLGGFLLTSARRLLWNAWFPCAVGLALLIFLPNFLWQVRHDFISLHFLQSIHKRDVGEGRADGFLIDQFKICANLFAAPVCIFGLVQFFRNRRYRALGWMYVVPFALFYFGKGRGYYAAAVYPMLMAMGAVASERWLATLSAVWQRVAKSVFFTGLFAYGLLICAILVPVTNSGPVKAFALRNNGDLREEFGWTELVKTVAGIRDSLPDDQRANVGVLTGNYGEQGAIEILGAAYGLPAPIGMTNSAWLRSYPVTPPTTLIVVGFSKADAEEAFTGCQLGRP